MHSLAGLSRPFGAASSTAFARTRGPERIVLDGYRFDSVARLRHLGRSRLVFGTQWVRSPPSRTRLRLPPAGHLLQRERSNWQILAQGHTTRKEVSSINMTRIAHVLRRVQTRATPQHEKILGSNQVPK